MKTTEPAPPDDVEGAAQLGALRDLVGYHLRRANSVFSNDFVRVLGASGMRQVLFGIMSVVTENPGINQGAAGRILGIQRANMVSLINELVDAGLLERQVSHEDRRAFCLFLTDTGRTRFDDCIAQILTHEDDLLSGLTATERRRLIALLGKIEAREG